MALMLWNVNGNNDGGNGMLKLTECKIFFKRPEGGLSGAKVIWREDCKFGGCMYSEFLVLTWSFLMIVSRWKYKLYLLQTSVLTAFLWQFILCELIGILAHVYRQLQLCINMA